MGQVDIRRGQRSVGARSGDGHNTTAREAGLAPVGRHPRRGASAHRTRHGDHRTLRNGDHGGERLRPALSPASARAACGPHVPARPRWRQGSPAPGPATRAEMGQQGAIGMGSVAGAMPPAYFTVCCNEDIWQCCLRPCQRTWRYSGHSVPISQEQQGRPPPYNSHCF